VERYYVSKFCRNYDSQSFGLNIRLSSIATGAVKDQIVELIGMGYDVSIFRVSAPLPLYFVTLMDSSNMGLKFMVAGTACHFNEYQALDGALSEAIQGLVVSLQGVREDLVRHKNKYNRNVFEGERDFIRFLS